MASCNYWDLTRAALVEKGLIEGGRIPGHAAHFETALVMALRPNWVDAEALAKVEDQSSAAGGLDVDLTGAVVQTYGTFQAGPGHTDNPADATPELGNAMLEVIVAQVAQFYRNFNKVLGPTLD